jgi:2-polyprenyl-3-methyl-5-hydroxy-6-metoxy-1,4-benzoquinol methylase
MPPSSAMPHTRLVPYQIRFPKLNLDLDQHEEFCEVKLDGTWERLRFHDYDKIYALPGFYEALFYRKLKCCSPSRVVGLLDDVMSDFPQDPTDLRVLDVGAGNGMVGQELWGVGVEHIVGIDIINEARHAATRDRPDTYNDYFVSDLCDLPPKTEQKLRDHQFNCLTTIAALGFGDIPTEAFTTAFNLIRRDGWIAFNIKEDFLDDADDTGFCVLIRRMIQEKVIQMQAYRRYCHRLSADGEPLHYIAMVASKQHDIPKDFLD